MHGVWIQETFLIDAESLTLCTRNLIGSLVMRIQSNVVLLRAFHVWRHYEKSLFRVRNVKLKGQRAFRTAAVGEPAVEDGTRKRRKKKVQPVLDVTRTDIEEALVDLQIKTNVCVYHCETDEDIALKIAVFTKAVAEKPFKYDWFKFWHIKSD